MRKSTLLFKRCALLAPAIIAMSGLLGSVQNAQAGYWQNFDVQYNGQDTAHIDGQTDQVVP